MRNMKKLASLLLALVMVFSLATTAFAATINKTKLEDEEGAEVDKFIGPASITVTLPNTSKAETANNTYYIYKVFNATTDGTNISYTLVDGKSDVPDGFTLTNGYVTYNNSDIKTLSEEDITAIAGYVNDEMLVATVQTTKDDNSFTVEGLPYGYYYITTTTGSVVTVNSTHPNANVNDKNVVPSVDKTITGASSISDAGKNALAQIGTDVTYTGSVTVGYGVENYVYHDTMGTGLSFKEDSVVVKVDNSIVTNTTDDVKYTLQTNPGNNETFIVSFENDYISSLPQSTVISIEYKATITAEALSEDPKNNTAYLSYGNDDDVDTTPTATTKVYNAKFTVNKINNKNEALAGAGFVIARTVADTSDGAANDATKTEYYKFEGNIVSWVSNIEQATEMFTSIVDGKAEVSFSGLADGSYTLIEKTVPAGYNKANDYGFTINAGSYDADNLEQSTTITNQQGSVLPSTGGMGTTLFYIFGSILVIGAIVLLVTKKRMGEAQ